jgi:hypothetical protein
MFDCFEPVLYLDPVSKFSEITERPGYFVEFSDTVVDSLAFKVLKNDITIETTYPDHFAYPVEYHTNWMELYPDAEEEIPNDLPDSKGTKSE